MAREVSLVEESFEFSTFSVDYITTAVDAADAELVAIDVNVTTWTGTSLQIDVEVSLSVEADGWRSTEQIAITGAGRYYGWLNSRNANSGEDGMQLFGAFRLRFQWSAVSAFACSARALLKP